MGCWGGYQTRVAGMMSGNVRLISCFKSRFKSCLYFPKSDGLERTSPALPASSLPNVRICSTGDGVRHARRPTGHPDSDSEGNFVRTESGKTAMKQERDVYELPSSTAVRYVLG